jgi:hypothetical protein
MNMVLVAKEFVADFVRTAYVFVYRIWRVVTCVKVFIDLVWSDVKTSSWKSVELAIANAFLVHPFGVCDGSMNAFVVDDSGAHCRMVIPEHGRSALFVCFAGLPDLAFDLYVCIVRRFLIGGYPTMLMCDAFVFV